MFSALLPTIFSKRRRSCNGTRGSTAAFDQSGNDKQPPKQIARRCLMHSSLAVQLTPLPLLTNAELQERKFIVHIGIGKNYKSKGKKGVPSCLPHCIVGDRVPEAKNNNTILNLSLKENHFTAFPYPYAPDYRVRGTRQDITSLKVFFSKKVWAIIKRHPINSFTRCA